MSDPEFTEEQLDALSRSVGEHIPNEDHRAALQTILQALREQLDRSYTPSGDDSEVTVETKTTTTTTTTTVQKGRGVRP
jgi:hypothetical protein